MIAARRLGDAKRTWRDLSDPGSSAPPRDRFWVPITLLLAVPPIRACRNVCTQQRRAARYNIGVKVFISHNAQDKETARLLAMLFTERGIGVWFDEWQIKPGESITGGFGKGIEECNVFVLLWSAAAKGSRWVDTDVRAAIR